MAATTTAREKYYANWVYYVEPLRLEPDLSNADYIWGQRALAGFAARTRSGFYGHGRQVQAGTASAALTAVGTTIAMDIGENPTKLQGTEKFTPRLGQIVAGWRRHDSPTEKKLLIEVKVSEKMAQLGRLTCATALVRAIGELALIAFYSL